MVDQEKLLQATLKLQSEVNRLFKVMKEKKGERHLKVIKPA